MFAMEAFSELGPEEKKDTRTSAKTIHFHPPQNTMDVCACACVCERQIGGGKQMAL